jgi:hypothetical protein
MQRKWHPSFNAMLEETQPLGRGKKAEIKFMSRFHLLKEVYNSRCQLFLEIVL